MGVTSEKAARPITGTSTWRISSDAYAHDEMQSLANTASAVGLPRVSCSRRSLCSGGPSSLDFKRYDKGSGSTGAGDADDVLGASGAGASGVRRSSEITGSSQCDNPIAWRHPTAKNRGFCAKDALRRTPHGACARPARQASSDSAATVADPSLHRKVVRTCQALEAPHLLPSAGTSTKPPSTRARCPSIARIEC